MLPLKRYFSLTLILLLGACAPAESQVQSYAPTAIPQRRIPTAKTVSTRPPGCTIVSRKFTPDPKQPTIVPPPGPGEWSRGKAGAPVTIIEYSDFQCPGCTTATSVLAQLVEKYPEGVYLTYRHFPLIDKYDKAALAVQGAEAAGKQDKFWEMHDLLFSRQAEWAGMPKEEFQAWLVQRAKDLDLDVDRFETDLTSPALVALAKQAYEQNDARNMSGTPYLIINGEPYNGPIDMGNLETIVTLMMLEERQFSDCPPITIDTNKQYLATLHTEKGDITLELYADKAPLAVNSFIFLAKKGWFDGVTFHRVLPGFVAQGGDPSGTGYGGPGYAFDNEISDLTFDGPGVVGMANAGPGSNGSQFFISYTALPQLNGGYTVFGRVLSGMDVLQQLTPRDPAKSMELPPGDKITHITIVEK